MRVMTYNIRGGLGIDNKRSLARIADVIRGAGADIVCMQEVGRRWPGSGYKDQPKWLGGKLGMQFVYQPNILVGPAGFGNLILSKIPVITAKSHRLTSVGEPRGLLEVQLHSDGGVLTVFCTHWGLSSEERVVQSKETSISVGLSHSPKLLCGDLNETDTGTAVMNLLQSSGLHDLALDASCTDLTYPSDTPQARIDFILGSDEFVIARAETIDSPASDHRPVLLDLSISS